MDYKMAELNLDYFHRSLIGLVKNAIDGEATSIAIRINVHYHRIQIVDNGIGFPFDILRNIGEYNTKTIAFNSNNNNSDRYYYLCHQNYCSIIQNIAEILFVASRYEHSHECYEKIFKKRFMSRVKTISNRPTCGTTSTIYLQENLMDNNFCLSIFATSINHLAKNYPQVSFSIRDDDRLQMHLQIKKKYKKQPEMKKYFTKSTNSLISSLIPIPKRKLRGISENGDKKSFFKYTFYPMNKIIELPSEITEKNDKLLNIEGKMNKSMNIMGQMDIENEIIPSQWSDWDLESPNDRNRVDNLVETRRYKFLPTKLTNLLPANANIKLVNRKMTQEFNTCGVFNYFNNLPRRQDFDVRPCNKIKKLNEEWKVTLERESLKHMEVLNQINSEFIAATVLQNGKKLLILIDQHAMHERIRYENLLKDYKDEQNKLTSVKLQRVIKINDIPTDICKLILKNNKLFINFGLQLSHDIATNSIIIIKTIPKCFSRKKQNNLTILTSIIRQLLMEIINKLINGIGFHNLPLTIHNAIASEACHGAIKFGDSLNFDQCNVMVDYWKQTDFPNRCAHGRPVIIPLLSIDN